jgi:hypothetical protein
VIDNVLWGEPDGTALQGVFPCGPKIRCEILSSDSKSKFMNTLKAKFANCTARRIQSKDTATRYISVGMYNIHTWGEIVKWPHPPDLCNLPTDLTVVESEESHARYLCIILHCLHQFDLFLNSLILLWVGSGACLRILSHFMMETAPQAHIPQYKGLTFL